MKEAQPERSREEKLTLEMLARPALGRQELSLLVMRLIELRHPATEVAFISDREIKMTGADGRTSSMFLDNLWAECQQSPEDRAEIVERYVRVLAPADILQQKVEVALGNIVALVRDEVYRDYISQDDRDLITRHLMGDLWVVYALDFPESTDILQKEIALTLRLDAEALLRIGRENVGRILGPIEFSPYGECFTLECEMVCYASSSLLLNYVWEKAGKLVSGDLVIVVPARDTLLFTGSENAQGLRELREQARYVTTNGHHVVSDTLLRRVGGEWKVFS